MNVFIVHMWRVDRNSCDVEVENRALPAADILDLNRSLLCDEERLVHKYAQLS